MGNIKILHCLETIGSEGVEQTRLSLARLLDKDKYEQKIVCTKSLGVLPDEMEKEGMEVFEVGLLNKIYNPQPYKRVNKILDSYQPDIIHGAVFEGNAMASVCGKLKNVPVVITEETSDPANRSWRGDQLIKWLYKLSDKTIGVSPDDCHYLTEKLGLKEKDIELVNNGVGEKLGWSEKRIKYLKSQFSISEDDFVIGTVARLNNDEHKRVSVFIKMMELLKSGNSSYKLLVVGDGEGKGMLNDLASRLSVEDRVILVGYQPDPTPFYQIMDVFALASQREAFGLVNVEAMFRNLPVVATNVGGIPSIVQDGETGFLVPPNDVKAFCNAIKKLCNDEELRVKMGKKGYERAKEHFTAEAYAQKVDQLYRSLLKEKRVV